MRLGTGPVCILLITYLLLAPGPAQAAYPQNPLLFNETVYVSQQGVYKFARGQSKPLWSGLAGIQTFAPVHFANLLLVGTTQGLYALDTGTGQIAWRIEPQKTVFSPSVSDQSGIAYAGSVHGEMYAIETRNGNIHWRRQFTGWIYSPVIAEKSGRLWSGGQEHRVHEIDSGNGRLTRQIATTQESVFSPVDIGDDQVAFNLFDGTTLLVGLNSAKTNVILGGDSQPTGIYADSTNLYRSHRDGSLSAFNRKTLELRWHRSLTRGGLFIHPSQPGYLLLSDNDRFTVLFDLGEPVDTCQVQNDLFWMLPLQFKDRTIIHFKKSMQPPGLSLVQTEAHCK